MAIQTSNKIQDSILEHVRTQLETVGYWEGVVMSVSSFANSAVLITIGGRPLGTTFPIPNDSTVFCDIQYTTYGSASTHYGQMGDIRCGGGRNAGNTVVAEVVNTANTFVHQEGAAALDFNAGATTNPLTFTATANTTNQGINLTVSGTAASETYFVGKMVLVCAKKEGMPRRSLL